MEDRIVLTCNHLEASRRLASAAGHQRPQRTDREVLMDEPARGVSQKDIGAAGMEAKDLLERSAIIHIPRATRRPASRRAVCRTSRLVAIEPAPKRWKQPNTTLRLEKA